MRSCGKAGDLRSHGGGRCVGEAHGGAKDEDEVLRCEVGGVGQEEVGCGEVEEGEGAKEEGRGYDGHDFEGGKKPCRFYGSEREIRFFSSAKKLVLGIGIVMNVLS